MQIICLSQAPQWKEPAAAWFHEKWGIPLAAYQESMDEYLSGGGAVPQWYLALEGERILGGRGMETLYLLTDHTGFYERYGWSYLCPVTGDGETQPSRMYVKSTCAADGGAV